MTRARDIATQGGLVLLNTTTFSAQSTVSFNNVFSATYDNYLIHIASTGSTTAVDVNMRLRVSGVDNSSTIYSRSSLYQSSTTVSGQLLTGQTVWVGIAAAQSSKRQFAQLTVFNPFATEYTAAIGDQMDNTNGNVTQSRRAFGTTVTTSYDGCTISADSGTITGTISVYGIRK